MHRLRLPAAVLAVAVFLAGPVRAQFGPTPVYLEPVEKRTIRLTVELVGTAEARRRAVIGAEVAGRVEAMDADAGDYLPANGVLCRVRATPVRLQLEQAQASLARARADLAKMEAGYRAEDIAQAQARQAATQAEFDRWKLEYERTRRLLADGASTAAEMEATEAAYRTARQRLAEADAGLALLKAGYRPEDVTMARATVAAETAAVAALQDTLDKLTVRMPFAGFVVAKQCEVGEWLSPGLPVASVLDLEVVRVTLDVPERYLPALRRGATAPVVFPALGDARDFAGRISQVVPASAEGTHTVTVRVDVPNTMEADRPTIAAGLLARVSLPVGEAHEALLVPKAAVVRQQGRDVVYRAQATPPAGAAGTPEAGTAGQAGGEGVQYAVRVYVDIVAGYGRFMEVRSPDLKPGMPLVTRGTYLMAPGMPVKATQKERASGPPAAEGNAAPPDSRPTDRVGPGVRE